ncbi:hypothetical protein [Rhizobium sp. AAP43]|uniref:hypothetical protein n=1 Tax=Rhizobium sp. AAP43 TaxID=1523420 RepID=UPI0006B9E42C|nr:hypothetical protein [Rhizobium sp. AAP43]KPF47091.1 hypothetical protein IP76_01995 [Rhizobium sp. AAP43]
MRAPLSIIIHDASFGIWQDNPHDPTFRSEIYAELIRRMRGRGWSIRADRETRKRYPSLSPSQREGAKGTLRCAIEITGRVVRIEFWSETAPQINTYGRFYDFDKLKRMSRQDARRVELEFRRLLTWLEGLAQIEVKRSGEAGIPALARIEKRYAESWHTDKHLGRPICTCDSNRKSSDGSLLEHGQTVWFAGPGGRILRGTAYYNINNMWWVVAGGKLHNESSGRLFASQPENLRTKRNARERRNRLERELQTAVQRMDFQRAHILKSILFGNEQTYMIWARGNAAYYRSQYAGYTTDSAAAGRYTKAEAEAECRRLPHELEMVCPDGTRVRFDRKEAA